MALLLCIETSAAVCSVCLSRNGTVVDWREDRSKNSHARVLTVLIADLLKANDIDYKTLDGIAVSAGPGSYTGLRIGASTAKGLCYALNKPLIAVPTLLSLAEAIRNKVEDENTLAMPVIDARRMDVYAGVFDNAGKELLPVTAYTINEALEETTTKLGRIAVGGDEMEKCRTVFHSLNIEFVEGIECHARLLSAIAERKFNNGETESVAYFEPFYLKEFGKQTS